MIKRCKCGKIASSKKPCKSCASVYPMAHCHNRAHMNHGLAYRNAYGYAMEDLGPCTDVHAHPYDDIEHLNEPTHS